MSNDVAIKIEGLKKQYKLGQIGGGTLTADLQSLVGAHPWKRGSQQQDRRRYAQQRGNLYGPEWH